MYTEDNLWFWRVFEDGDNEQPETPKVQRGKKKGPTENWEGEKQMDERPKREKF